MAERKTEYPIDNVFIERWSPRAMSGENITNEELMTLFEAARWAPSSYNGQPWRFIYAHRQTPAWDKFYNLLIEFNQQWCENAAVLVAFISRKNFEFNDEPARTHSFDAGSAWMSLALQGFMKGYVVHGMEGFDYEKAKAVLHIPDDYQVEAMCAIGRPGKKEDLPPEIAAKEVKSDRKPLSDLVFEGSFKS